MAPHAAQVRACLACLTCTMASIKGVPHRHIAQAFQRTEQLLDGSMAIMAELLHHTRSCTASSDDTQVGIIQLGDAMQPTDQWAFWSRIGFKGPVTKAELCRCFRPGELQGCVLIHLVSQDSTTGKELKGFYEQWGPHMPGVQPTGCMHQLQLTMLCLRYCQIGHRFATTLTVFPAWQLYAELYVPEHTAFCPVQSCLCAVSIADVLPRN